MKINKLNYENFVIDYIEGTLAGDQKGAFDLFIQEHPEVYEEIKDFISAPIIKEDESIRFENKEELLVKASSLSFLWILIPILLLGAGFILSYNQSDKISHLPKEEFKKNLPLAAETEVENKTAELAPNDPPIKEIPESNTTTSIAAVHTVKPRPTEVKVINKPIITSLSIPEETQVFATAEVLNIVITKEIELTGDIKREELNKLIPIPQEKSSLSLAQTKSNVSMNFSNKTVLAKRDAYWKDLKEVFATSAYKEVDFKEAITSESVTEFMKERKLLKSFIPETFTKK